MDTGSLVEQDIQRGRRLLEVLDAADFGVSAALWLYSSDLETWKLTIAYKGEKKDIEKKIHEAAHVVSKAREELNDESILDLSRVRIVHDSDILISGLRPIISVNGISTVRFSRNMINGIFVEDALIYRMAA